MPRVDTRLLYWTFTDESLPYERRAAALDRLKALYAKKGAQQ